MVHVCTVIICLHGNLSSHFGLYSLTDSLINALNCEERIPTRCSNSDVYCQFQMFIINNCLNMFWVSLCPSSGEQRPCITAYGVCAGSAGCGWLQLWGIML